MRDRGRDLPFALWLAVRSALTRPGETVWRLGVGAVAVVVLLVAATLEPTALARSERVAAAMLPLSPVGTATTGIRLLQVEDHFAGAPILVRRVATVGPRKDWDHGHRIPAPGELVVSPAMKELLDTSAELRRRYPGVVVLVAEGSGTGPRSLVLWQGVENDSLPADAGWLAPGPAFAVDVARSVPTEVAYATPMLVTGFLLPLLALFFLLATLGARRREQRLAALRLLGASDATVRLSSSLEAAALAALGALAGVLAFVVVAPWVAPSLPVEGGVWPEDLRLPGVRTALALLVLPTIAWVTSAWSLRALGESPLALEQQTRVPSVRRWPLVLLAVGTLGALGVILGLVPSDRAPASVLVVSAVALMLGLVASVPGALLVTSRLAARRAGPLTVLLAARRVAAHPQRAARVATGLTLLVVMSGPLLVFLPLIADAGADSLTGLGRTVGRQTLLSQQGPAEADDAAARHRQWDEMSADPAVAARLTLWSVDVAAVGGPGARITTTPVLVADCDALEEVAAVPASVCRDGVLLGEARLPASARAALFTERVDDADGTVHPDRVGEPFVLPGRWRHLDPADGSAGALTRLVGGLDSPAVALLALDRVGDTAALDRFARSDFVVPADGEVERARSEVVLSTGSVALGIEEREAMARRTTHEFEVAARVAAALVVAIAVLATCLTAVEVVGDTAPVRRQLEFEGAPRTLMRRTLVGQVAMPTVLVVIPAAMASWLMAAAFAHLVDFTDVTVPLRTIASTAGLAALAPVLAAYAVERIHTPDRHVAGEQ